MPLGYKVEVRSLLYHIIVTYAFVLSLQNGRMIRTQPFLREVSYEKPSERHTERFIAPRQQFDQSSNAVYLTKKKGRMVSLRKRLKKWHFA